LSASLEGIILDNLFTVEIESLVYEGNGFSRLPDGKAVFVPFVMPGERVVVRLREEKKGFALADLVSIEKPHPERVAPRCLHFGVCGGCHYQHIPYTLQLAYKKDILVEQLHRIAGINSPTVDKVISAPEIWNYRNTIQFQVSPQGKLCFAAARDNAFFEVQECHLPMDAVGSLWPQMLFENDSYLGRLEMRQNLSGDLLLEFEGEAGEIPEIESESNVSLVSLAGADTVVLAGEDYLVMEVQGRPFIVSAGSFFQTNFAGAETLVNEVCRLVKECGCHRLLDIYSGVGLFSAFLAGDVDELVAIESNPSSCKDFAQNLDDYENVSLYEGLAEQVLPALDFRPDGVIVDPPRTGLKPKARQALVDLHPEFILYGSCNPATLARDLNHLLQAGYQIQQTILVDMFPQTYHIESVILMSRVDN
jgi:23S rRNA (uracil1939-C5)-methyltransferase